MLLSDVIAALRLDLFDPSGGPQQRWSDMDLQRAIDKAVERYTQYYPAIGWIDLATQPFQRTYAYPVPTNPAYPVLWLERILYPLQVPGTTFAAPATGPVLAQSGSGTVNGTVQYAVTFLTPGGETTPGPASSLTLSNGQVLEVRDGQNEMYGGSSDTEVTDWQVNPIGRRPSKAVMIATPVQKCPRTWRMAAGDGAGESGFAATGVPVIVLLCVDDSPCPGGGCRATALSRSAGACPAISPAPVDNL